MNKPVRVVFIDEAQEAYKQLNKTVGDQQTQGKTKTDEIQLWNSIQQKISLIKQNPFYGDNIPKQQIPKTMNVTNLWRAELTGYWRMLYTIKGDNIEVI
ncbi:MAG: hypothetical protein AABX47_06985 [Nanoarchaeota archaeon]